MELFLPIVFVLSHSSSVPLSFKSEIFKSYGPRPSKTRLDNSLLSGIRVSGSLNASLIPHALLYVRSVKCPSKVDLWNFRAFDHFQTRMVCPREKGREREKIILAFDARSTMFRGRRQREEEKRGKVGWMLSRGFSGEVSAHNGETSPRSREGIKGHYPRQ